MFSEIVIRPFNIYFELGASNYYRGRESCDVPKMETWKIILLEANYGVR